MVKVNIIIIVLLSIAHVPVIADTHAHDALRLTISETPRNQQEAPVLWPHPCAYHSVQLVRSERLLNPDLKEYPKKTEAVFLFS